MNRSGTGAQALRIEKKRLAVGQTAAASVKKARISELSKKLQFASVIC
jgi:hypothetical protein